MKKIFSVMALTALTFLLGCGQNENNNSSSNSTNTTSEALTVATNVVNAVTTNVVNAATNAYETVTNAVLTNSNPNP
jgi:hypothetical protein